MSDPALGVAVMLEVVESEGKTVLSIKAFSYTHTHIGLILVQLQDLLDALLDQRLKINRYSSLLSSSAIIWLATRL